MDEEGKKIEANTKKDNEDKNTNDVKIDFNSFLSNKTTRTQSKIDSERETFRKELLS